MILLILGWGRRSISYEARAELSQMDAALFAPQHVIEDGFAGSMFQSLL